MKLGDLISADQTLLDAEVLGALPRTADNVLLFGLSEDDPTSLTSLWAVSPGSKQIDEMEATAYFSELGDWRVGSVTVDNDGFRLTKRLSWCYSSLEAAKLAAGVV